VSALASTGEVRGQDTDSRSGSQVGQLQI
jgi:hypothetical protein